MSVFFVLVTNLALSAALQVQIAICLHREKVSAFKLEKEASFLFVTGVSELQSQNMRLAILPTAYFKLGARGVMTPRKKTQIRNTKKYLPLSLLLGIIFAKKRDKK